MASARGRMLGSIFGFLFGLPFLCVGIGATIYFMSFIWQYVSAQRWVETPAYVVAGMLSESHGDSTTYQAQATYTYTFEGREYTGTQVGLIGGHDNIGPWQQDAWAKIEPHVGTRKPMAAYVNPARPEQAVLLRDLRYGMAAFVLMFALIFSVVGIAICGAALTSEKAAIAMMEKQAASPEEPWLWNPEWASGLIVSKSAKAGYVGLGIAIFWLLVSSPLVAIVPAEVMESGDYAMLMVMVFPLIGIGLLISALVSIARARKYGESVLIMDSPTGLIGGYFSGTVTVPHPIDAPGGVVAMLKCQTEETTGSGKNRRTSTKTLWQDEQSVAPQGGERFGEGVTMPMRFAIPSGLPSVDLQGNEKVRWVLRLEAEAAGLDYHADFDVPVYSVPGMEAIDAVPQGAAATVAEPHVPIDPRTVRIDFFKDGALFTYPRTRHLFGGAFLMGMGAFFTAFVPLLYIHAPLFFAGIWGGFSLLMIIGALGMLTNELRVDVKPGTLEVVSDYIIFRRRQQYTQADIQAFDVNSNLRIGDEDIYRIQLKTKADKTHTVGSGFKSKRMADQVAELMRLTLEPARAQG